MGRVVNKSSRGAEALVRRNRLEVGGKEFQDESLFILGGGHPRNNFHFGANSHQTARQWAAALALCSQAAQAWPEKGVACLRRSRFSIHTDKERHSQKASSVAQLIRIIRLSFLVQVCLADLGPWLSSTL